MNVTILWSQLDRWDYTGAVPSPPKSNLYTLLSLQSTFIALMVLSILQFIAILVVKRCYSTDFSKRRFTKPIRFFILWRT